jgi:hypothetical protein
MAKTNMLGLERVQYRALRVALGLMGYTPNNCLGVIGGIPPLAERFAYLNFRYLVAVFYRLGHPLRARLGVLVRRAFLIRMTLLLSYVRASLFIKWLWVDLDIRSKVQLVFSLLRLVLSSLLYETSGYW